MPPTRSVGQGTVVEGSGFEQALSTQSPSPPRALSPQSPLHPEPSPPPLHPSLPPSTPSNPLSTTLHPSLPVTFTLSKPPQPYHFNLSPF
ncbi:unnamed protein product [Gadus morhua 'NCC']